MPPPPLAFHRWARRARARPERCRISLDTLMRWWSEAGEVGLYLMEAHERTGPEGAHGVGTPTVAMVARGTLRWAGFG